MPSPAVEHFDLAMKRVPSVVTHVPSRATSPILLTSGADTEDFELVKKTVIRDGFHHPDITEGFSSRVLGQSSAPAEHVRLFDEQTRRQRRPHQD